jgi:soluble P-type ATPase
MKQNKMTETEVKLFLTSMNEMGSFLKYCKDKNIMLENVIMIADKNKRIEILEALNWYKEVVTTLQKGKSHETA